MDLVDKTAGQTVARRASFAGTFASTNARPEVYNADHVRGLGDAQQEWELFVDGYDANGKRVCILQCCATPATVIFATHDCTVKALQSAVKECLSKWLMTARQT